MTEKFCTKCGKKFFAIGRQVICPDCKAAAEEESKRAAVERAKRASWSGESVPVRISGRASTIIRKHGEEHNMSFAESLDALLKASSFFEKLGVEWSTIQPYKSHRRDKSTATSTTENKQEAPQDVQTSKQATSKPQEVKQAAKTSTSKATTSKTSTAKKAVKTAAGRKGEKSC